MQSIHLKVGVSCIKWWLRINPAGCLFALRSDDLILKPTTFVRVSASCTVFLYNPCSLIFSVPVRSAYRDQVGNDFVVQLLLHLPTTKSRKQNLLWFCAFKMPRERRSLSTCWPAGLQSKRGKFSEAIWPIAKCLAREFRLEFRASQVQMVIKAMTQNHNWWKSQNCKRKWPELMHTTAYKCSWFLPKLPASWNHPDTLQSIQQIWRLRHFRVKSTSDGFGYQASKVGSVLRIICHMGHMRPYLTIWLENHKVTCEKHSKKHRRTKKRHPLGAEISPKVSLWMSEDRTHLAALYSTQPLMALVIMKVCPCGKLTSWPWLCYVYSMHPHEETLINFHLMIEKN